MTDIDAQTTIRNGDPLASRMTRAPSSFRQSAVTRLLKAARAAGFDVGRVEVDPMDGKIVLVAKSQTSESITDLEKWKLSRARPS